jgi:site-specific DNA-methyltransferase (adenine-specific)
MIEPVFANRYGVLHHGDCMDVFASMRDRSVACVFADPPFNLRKVYG